MEADQLPIRRRQHDRNETDGHEPHGGAEDGGPAAVQIADPAAECRPQQSPDLHAGPPVDEISSIS